VFHKARNSKKRYLIARLVGVGWFVALLISGGAVGGFFLDEWLGLSPAFTMTGVLVGLGLSVFGMYRMILAILRE